MRILRPGLPFAIVFGSLAAFCVAGHFAVTAFIEALQVRQLSDLADVVLRRSEAAVDFASASIDEIARTGRVGCDPSSLQAMRLHVYQRSAVKDVRLLNSDGSVVCSAYSETLEFDKGWVKRPDMLASHIAGLMLFRVEQFGGDALGVLRDLDGSRALAAVIGINSNLFDIMPAELRPRSKVQVELSNGQQLGHFALRDIDPAHNVEFVSRSSQYPLQAMIRVDRGARAIWSTQAYWPAMLVAAALGLIFGLVLTRTGRLEGPLAELDRALAKGQIRPFFQPTFHLHTGEILGCEVLARWIRDDGSIVPPMKFIPLAESSGRIRPLTWQVLNAALKEMNALLRENKEFKLSLNVVPGHVLDPSFVDTLRRNVASAKVSARQIVLEITERDKLDNIDSAAQVVHELRNLGFKVAIDDVGVGHSGLSHLKGLGATTMKIDKFFVDTVTRDGSTAAIVEMLVRLARDLHMTVIAEGIETEDQVHALRNCGVEEGQGYLVSPPVPAAKFLELIEIRRARLDMLKALDAPLVA
jgi:sensor c-di-GMP phosphodiesterase-like protein